MASPLRLGPHTLRNRLVAVAHGLADVVDGAPTASDAAYWRRLASGGAAMVITGGTVVAPESTLPRPYLTEAYRTDILPALRRRAEAITAQGAAAIAQLVHLGRETLGAANHHAPVSASAVRSPREPARPRPLVSAEIRQIVTAFRISAANSVAAGFDGVELHAAHGYLLAQFLSRTNNLRNDQYGDRIALLCEVIQAIRAEIGAALIGVRLSVEGGPESGLGLDDLMELLPKLQAQARFDYLNITTGVRNSYVPGMATLRPPLMDDIGALRGISRVPLLISQSFRTVPDIETALSQGADLVGMARALIADPDLPNKVLSGRERSVRPCTACNEDCRTFEPTGLCSVNPDLAPSGGRHPAVALLLRHGDRRGSLAVLGAGPAGLECALTLAQRGCREIVVLDQARDVGGQARLAGLAPHRSGWQRFVDYQRAQLAELGVRLVLDTAPTADVLGSYNHLVLATGAEEDSPAIPGTLPTVSSTAFLRHVRESLAGQRIAVLDDGFGWWPGVSVVEAALAADAQEVTVISPGSSFAGMLSVENRTQLLARLAGAPLRVIPLSTVTRTSGTQVHLASVLDGNENSLSADILVVVGERRARTVDLEPVDGQTVLAVGDCVVPRRISHAVAEGRAAARAILTKV